VTYDTIPTTDSVRGLAVYGPGATLFTLGPNNTVQQFDLNAPAMMVNQIQHPANLLPPSPPISLEADDKGQQNSQSESESSVQISIHADIISEDDERGMSPLARLVRSDHGSDIERYRTATPASSAHSLSSVSISSSSSQTPANRNASSVISRGMTENTYISAGSSLRSGARDRVDRAERATQRESFSTTSSVSMGSSHYRSRHRPSRLRHEVPRSPEESKVTDLFKFTKSRLNDVPYKTPFGSDNVRLTNDDLRRQMLSTIFGWNKDAADLVRDEMSRHPLGSTNRILLAKWLGDINTDIMAMGSENMTSSDWMLLALSGIGGQQSQHKLGRAYVQRLLENGDVHAAATIMIGMGDHIDAVEIYVSHKRYMEALILTCLFFPAVWERQVGILRKWGEWAVQHGQQQLAIRCFACTGRESSEPWTSPSAQQVTFPSVTQTVPELLSPPMSPPSLSHGPQRSVAKASALKLITTFDTKPTNKFLAHVDDGKTPLAASNTPIAESALSPGGDPQTAVVRGGRSQFGTPVSARPGPQPFGRHRLPSIGEAPDSTYRDRELLTAITRPPGDPYANININPMDSMMNMEGGKALDLIRPHSSSPRLVKDTPQPPPSPSPAAAAALMGGPRQKNGPRARRPDGLDLSLAGHEAGADDITSPEPSATSSARFPWPRRRGPASVASSVTSASATSSVAGRSHRGRRRNNDDHYQGKSLDDYLQGPNATKAGKHRGTSRGRDNSRVSTERGRGESRGYTPKGGKRSPKSPVPMSPEDLINLATPKEEGGFESKQFMTDDRGQIIGIQLEPEPEPEQPSTVKKATAYRDTSASRNTSRTRRATSRDSRTRSPNRRIPPSLELRGRSSTRDKSTNRSPSSPQPMIADGRSYASSDEEDYRQALQAQERFRLRKSRSTSRGGRDGLASPSIARTNSGWGTRQKRIPTPLATPAPMQLVHNTDSDPANPAKDERRLKKEAAARELEERRRSLALRPTVPPILHPDELSPGRNGSPAPLLELPSTTYVPMRKEDLPSRSATADPTQQIRERSVYTSHSGPRMGLPATPKAMRLVLESDASKHSVPVPPMPAAYAQQHSPPAVQSNRSSPKKAEPEPASNDQAPMQLLPSTVYTPPPSRQAVGAGIARSMSAPPRDLAPPLSSNSRHTFNKSSLSISTGRRPSTDANIPRRPSNDGQIPPPPPPAPSAPPVLKELQHLAIPPPPPPAPLPHNAGPKPVVYGSSGMIEIVIDDDQPNPTPAAIPVATPVSENTVPVIAPPVPSSSRNGHHRGRSSVDNSIGARFSRATERMRSASRSRTIRDPALRVKSPESVAPYESVPPPPSMSYQMRADMAKSPPAPNLYNRDDFRTGLHQSEMI